MNNRQWLNVVIVAIAIMIVLLTTVSRKITGQLQNDPTPTLPKSINWHQIKTVTINQQTLSLKQLSSMSSPQALENWLMTWQQILNTSGENPAQLQQANGTTSRVNIIWNDGNQKEIVTLLIDSENNMYLKRLNTAWTAVHYNDQPKLLPTWLQPFFKGSNN